MARPTVAFVGRGGWGPDFVRLWPAASLPTFFGARAAKSWRQRRPRGFSERGLPNCDGIGIDGQFHWRNGGKKQTDVRRLNVVYGGSDRRTNRGKGDLLREDTRKDTRPIILSRGRGRVVTSDPGTKVGYWWLGISSGRPRIARDPQIVCGNASERHTCTAWWAKISA
ncbi:hypothetical protein BHM03_00030354 [Ensete ventricosum]|nr:hypothetical protein BHM03_00030354 [Ensete ventricosum]